MPMYTGHLSGTAIMAAIGQPISRRTPRGDAADQADLVVLSLTSLKSPNHNYTKLTKHAVNCQMNAETCVFFVTSH